MAKTLVYQMWPIAWKNLKEMTDHLDRVKNLEVDYIWLSPVYPSLRFDHGYDIYDYLAIDKRFGTMQDFDNFVKKAHKLGIGVLMDLVLNHTSIGHSWFTEKSGYYCWADDDRPGWENLFDGGPAWTKAHSNDPSEQAEMGYYLHLFHESQADLNWFPCGDNQINLALVQEFRKITNFWLQEHGIDGFRLDCPQALNKDFSREKLTFDDLLYGDKATAVINAIFADPNSPRTLDDKKPFLIMECFDPSFGDLVDYYTARTPVDFVMNVQLKESVDNGWETFLKNLRFSVRRANFMLDLESHDAPRFISRSGQTYESVFGQLFGTGAPGICIYQGQELGLTNPSWRELSDADMISLDARTAMRFKNGENLAQMRRLSRANARLPLPLPEYKKQERDPRSSLSTMKFWITSWKYW